MAKINISIKKLVAEASIPQNATQKDTGYDLIALSDPKIVGDAFSEKENLWKRIDYIEYKTGLQIRPENLLEFFQYDDLESIKGQKLYEFYTLIFPRSSISKYNLVMANSVGVIDNEYRGELLIRFKYIWQPEDYTIYMANYGQPQILMGSINMDKIYKKGDKIGQLAAFELNQINFKEVAQLEETVRNHGGFGSSDKK